jgi:protein-disulfide isomerase
MLGTFSTRWQSIVETLAVAAIAVAVGRIAFIAPAGERNSQKATAPTARKPEPPLPTSPIVLSGAQISGKTSAKVGLVVYSDFQCPFCGKFARETLPALERQYVSTGKVLLAFRHFPLPNHQFAQKAAEAATCAGRQGKFWQFHDQLFGNQQKLDAPSLQEDARSLGLNFDDFANCLGGQVTTMVQADKSTAEPLGIVGTPTFFVGRLLNDGRLQVAERLTGALPVSEFQGVLDRLIAGGDVLPRAGLH